MLKITFLILTATLLSSCANFEARPLTSTENSISLRYDPAFSSNLEKAAQKAKEHCA